MSSRSNQPKTRALVAATVLLLVLGGYLWMRHVGSRAASIGPVATATTDGETNVGDATNGARLANDTRAQTESRSPVVATPFGAQPDAAATGTLKGRVLDELGAGVEGTTVRLMVFNSIQHSARSDASGAYRFDDVPVGTSFVRFERGDLAAGFVFDSARAPLDARRYRGHGIRVESDGVSEYDIHLVHAAQLEGRVVDRDGAPIEGAPIRLTAKSLLDSKVDRTNRLGCFVIKDIEPLSYILQVQLDRVPSSTLRAESAVPLVVELASGEQRYLPDIVVGGGGHVLVGRVVDGEGDPVEGVPIEVVAMLERDREYIFGARTDKDGRYEMGRVPTSSVMVRVPASEWEAPPGERRFLGAVPSVDLDLRAESEQVEVPTFVGERARRFVLTVEFVATAQWRRTSNRDPAMDGMAMKYTATSVPAGALAPLIPAARPYDDLEINDTAVGPPAIAWRRGNSFRYACELPQEPFDLFITLLLADDTTIVRSQRVEPVQGGFVEAELHFP